MKSLFQWTVGGSFALYVFLFCFPYLWHLVYEEEIVFVLRYTGYGASHIAISYSGYLFIVLYGIAAIGLIKFKDWARKTFLALTILSLLMMPFSGLVIAGWYESLLWSLVTMADGVVLALAFFSSLNKDFKPAS